MAIMDLGVGELRSTRYDMHTLCVTRRFPRSDDYLVASAALLSLPISWRRERVA
jgi:hypothetical protein